VGVGGIGAVSGVGTDAELRGNDGTGGGFGASGVFWTGAGGAADGAVEPPLAAVGGDSGTGSSTGSGDDSGMGSPAVSTTGAARVPGSLRGGGVRNRGSDGA
jgi:hypothetical protein